MKRKCPRCGSSDVAKYIWGYPDFTEELEKDLADHKVILGDYCVTGNDPTSHCNSCGKDFGKPPYLQRRKGQPENAPRERFPAELTKIVFSVGGYFKGQDIVEIFADDNGHHSQYIHYPDIQDIKTPYTTDLTDAQWKKLMRTLFYKLCIHEWKQCYFDPTVLDGTQWRLELTLTKGRHYKIYGSNAFPPLYKDLVRVLKPYMKKPKDG